MSVPQQSPALPWASGQQAAQEKHEQSAAGEADDVRPISLDQLGLRLGDRIEVKWQVQPDEGDAMERWWGACITAAEPSAASSSDAPAYTIKYDTWPECDFTEEEEAEVTLLSTHRLLDLRQQDIMAWRRAGEDYEPPEESQDEDEEGVASGDEELADVEGAEGGSVTMAELAAGISDADLSAEDARLASAPQHVADGYKDFMENLKQFILAKASQAAGDGEDELLITTADVADFKAMMMTQAAGRGRTHRAA